MCQKLWKLVGRRQSYCSNNKKAKLSQRWPRPYMGAMKIFGSPWVRSRLLFPKFLMFFFQSILWMCVPNLKFVTLPFPEMIRGNPNLGSTRIRPRSLFSKIFHGLLFGWTLWLHRPNLKSVALPVPEIISIGVLCGVANLQSWGRGGRREAG